LKSEKTQDTYSRTLQYPRSTSLTQNSIYISTSTQVQFTPALHFTHNVRLSGTNRKTAATRNS